MPCSQRTSCWIQSFQQPTHLTRDGPLVMRHLQDGRDFADVISPKLPFMFDMAARNRFYFHVIKHLVEGEAGMPAGSRASTQLQVLHAKSATHQQLSSCRIPNVLQLLGLESIVT